MDERDLKFLRSTINDLESHLEHIFSLPEKNFREAVLGLVYATVGRTLEPEEEEFEWIYNRSVEQVKRDYEELLRVRVAADVILGVESRSQTLTDVRRNLIGGYSDLFWRRNCGG